MSDIPALYFTWILPNLAMGGARAVEHAEQLARSHGIGHIVDVRVEQRDDEEILRRHRITLLHLPTEDFCAIAPQMIDHGVNWVRRHLDRGDKVFIHCQVGIGRSALLTCCVLVSMGNTPAQALRIAKKKRPVVSPSREQLEALLQWSVHFRKRRGLPPHATTWQDLADIAYRP